LAPLAKKLTVSVACVFVLSKRIRIGKTQQPAQQAIAVDNSASKH
jgi:hypothetical protein